MFGKLKEKLRRAVPLLVVLVILLLIAAYFDNQNLVLRCSGYRVRGAACVLEYRRANGGGKLRIMHEECHSFCCGDNATALLAFQERQIPSNVTVDIQQNDTYYLIHVIQVIAWGRLFCLESTRCANGKWLSESIHAGRRCMNPH